MTGAVLAMGGPSDFSTVVVLYGGPLVVTILFGLASAGPPMPPAWDAGETRRLAVVGVPIMLAGLVFSVFVTMDRWMAIALLGFERAAPYALASLIATAMLVVPTVVSQQTYPRMAIARGRGASSEELFAMAHHQGLIAASIVAPIGVALVVFGWLGIPALLPAYIDAGPAVVVLSFGFVTLAFMTGYGNYLNVVGAQWQYLGAQVTAAGIAVIFILVGGLTLGLTGIAVGMAASHAIYGVLLRTVAGRFLRASELPQPRRSQAAE
jgi:O-antigen/teichoic acid export membrane protein